jgi:hypothetical protein
VNDNYYEDLDYKDLAKLLLQLKGSVDELDKQTKEMRAQFDHLRLRVIPDRMNEDGIQSIRLAGVGVLKLTNDAYCSTKAGRKEEVLKWLRGQDFGELITETVSASTLKALAKELVLNEGDLGELSDLVNFTPFQRASITKS